MRAAGNDGHCTSSSVITSTHCYLWQLQVQVQHVQVQLRCCCQFGLPGSSLRVFYNTAVLQVCCNCASTTCTLLLPVWSPWFKSSCILRYCCIAVCCNCASTTCTAAASLVSLVQVFVYFTILLYCKSAVIVQVSIVQHALLLPFVFPWFMLHPHRVARCCC